MRKTTSIIKFIPILIIVVVSFVVYFNAIFGDFVYDDNDQIVGNPWIRGIRNMSPIFFRNVWGFQGGTTISNYYRPLMHVIYMSNYYLFGLKPWGFHLTNIIFHCGVSVLVFLMLRVFLENSIVSKSSYRSPSFIGAILFATQPIHTEAVTWIGGLPDVAFTFFFLLSFYLYVRTEGKKNCKHILSVTSFALATLFKEPALTLPVILLAYDFIVAERRGSPLIYVKRYAPFLIIMTIYIVLRMHALGEFAPEKRHIELDTYECVLNTFPLFTQYLQKLLFPVNLNVFYVFHPILTIIDLKGIVSLIGTIVFVVLTFVSVKKNRTAFLGLLLIVFPLLPALYIPSLGENVFTERYLYLPSVGYVVLIAVLMSWARNKPHVVTVLLSILMILIAGLYATGTVKRNDAWKNNFVLWSDTVNKSPDSSIAHAGLGLAYESKGLLDMAMEQYQIALRLNPDLVEAHNNLGIVYASRGLLDMAMEQYQIALRLNPDYANAHYNLGLVYSAKGQLDMAMEQYQIALRLNPDDADAHFGLGLIYLNNGSQNMARTEFELGLAKKPDDYRAREILNSIISK